MTPKGEEFIEKLEDFVDTIKSADTPTRIKLACTLLILLFCFVTIGVASLEGVRDKPEAEIAKSSQTITLYDIANYFTIQQRSIITTHKDQSLIAARFSFPQKSFIQESRHSFNNGVELESDFSFNGPHLIVKRADNGSFEVGEHIFEISLTTFDAITIDGAKRKLEWLANGQSDTPISIELITIDTTNLGLPSSVGITPFLKSGSSTLEIPAQDFLINRYGPQIDFSYTKNIEPNHQLLLKISWTS